MFLIPSLHLVGLMGDGFILSSALVMALVKGL